MLINYVHVFEKVTKRRSLLRQNGWIVYTLDQTPTRQHFQLLRKNVSLFITHILLYISLTFIFLVVINIHQLTSLTTCSTTVSGQLLVGPCILLKSSCAENVDWALRKTDMVHPLPHIERCDNLETRFSLGFTWNLFQEEIYQGRREMTGAEVH
jgi:hypothetical protein